MFAVRGLGVRSMLVMQLELFPAVERRYAIIECRDAKGNAWRHRVSDPEETARFIERELEGVKCEVLQ